MNNDKNKHENFSKKKLIITLPLVFILIFSFIFRWDIVFAMNPERQIKKSINDSITQLYNIKLNNNDYLKNLGKSENIYSSLNSTLLDYEPNTSGDKNSSSIYMLGNLNFKNKVANFNLESTIDNENLITFRSEFGNKSIYLSMAELYDKTFEIPSKVDENTWNNSILAAQFGPISEPFDLSFDSINEELKLVKIRKLLASDYDFKDYSKILIDFIDSKELENVGKEIEMIDGKNHNIYKYSLTVTKNDYDNLRLNYYNLLLEDKALEEFMKDFYEIFNSFNYGEIPEYESFTEYVNNLKDNIDLDEKYENEKLVFTLGISDGRLITLDVEDYFDDEIYPLLKVNFTDYKNNLYSFIAYQYDGDTSYNEQENITPITKISNINYLLKDDAIKNLLTIEEILNDNETSELLKLSTDIDLSKTKDNFKIKLDSSDIYQKRSYDISGDLTLNKDELLFKSDKIKLETKYNFSEEENNSVGISFNLDLKLSSKNLDFKPVDKNKIVKPLNLSSDDSDEMLLTIEKNLIKLQEKFINLGNRS